VNFLTDTKVLNDTFVQLFGFNASGVIALCRRSYSKGASQRGDTTKATQLLYDDGAEFFVRHASVA
jgi:hypothetical protein